MVLVSPSTELTQGKNARAIRCGKTPDWLSMTWPTSVRQKCQ